MELNFNIDRHIFRQLLILTLMFMILYTLGTSVPAWYILEEHMTNISRCKSADKYLSTQVRARWNPELTTKLTIKASLWYMNIDLKNAEVEFKQFLPFIFVQDATITERQNGIAIQNIFPKCITTIITLTLLAMGITFTFSVSNQPARLIYYGLSSVMLLGAITTWITVAVTSSEKFVLSVGFDFCLDMGAVHTSVLLQVLTGTAGILAFVLSCIIINVAVSINAKCMKDNVKDEDRQSSTECYQQPAASI